MGEQLGEYPEAAGLKSLALSHTYGGTETVRKCWAAQTGNSGSRNLSKKGIKARAHACARVFSMTLFIVKKKNQTVNWVNVEEDKLLNMARYQITEHYTASKSTINLMERALDSLYDKNQLK